MVTLRLTSQAPALWPLGKVRPLPSPEEGGPGQLRAQSPAEETSVGCGGLRGTSPPPPLTGGLSLLTSSPGIGRRGEGQANLPARCPRTAWRGPLGPWEVDVIVCGPHPQSRAWKQRYCVVRAERFTVCSLHWVQKHWTEGNSNGSGEKLLRASGRRAHQELRERPVSAAAAPLHTRGGPRQASEPLGSERGLLAPAPHLPAAGRPGPVGADGTRAGRGPSSEAQLTLDPGLLTELRTQPKSTSKS